MKKFIAAIATFIYFLSFYAFADGFSQDTAGIEKAADNVLMLGIFDDAYELISTGSGFVAFDSTTLVTNYHVIEDAYYIVAISDDDEYFEIDKLYCSDAQSDIAILGFSEKTSFQPLPIKASNTLMRGMPVITIGSPQGLKNTVSIGNISAIYEENGIPYIQFTAPVSHGSSGGALFNDNGEVIGITSSSYTDSQNLNIAINIAAVKAMYNAWSGEIRNISDPTKKAKFDYTGVYEDHNNNSVSDTSVWTCFSCGTKNDTRFCTECGVEKPVWTCKCGKINNGKFCGSCGEAVAELLNRINNALSFHDNAEYEKAIELFQELGHFNSMSLSTNAGKYIIAENQLLASFYMVAENALKEQKYAEAIAFYKKASDYQNSKERLLFAHLEYGKRLLDSKCYEEAIEHFIMADDYKNAFEMLDETYYRMGYDFLSVKDYGNAITAFSEIANKEKSDVLISQAHYSKAEDYLESGTEASLLAAIEIFNELQDYRDSCDRKKEAELALSKLYYTQGSACIDSKNYEEAIRLFQKASIVDESVNQIKRCYYLMGSEFLNNGQYSEATAAFHNAEGYLDSNEKIIDVRYQEGLYYYKIKKYDTAREILSEILDYKDANDIYIESTYMRAEEYYFIYRFYKTAIDLYTECSGYKDADEKMKNALCEAIIKYLSEGKYAEAFRIFEENKHIEIDQKLLIVANVDMIGNGVNAVLKHAYNMKFIGWLPENENMYKEKYKSPIMQMERHFGLESDGIITIEEMVFLDGIIYPGKKGIDIEKLLEKASDLEYLTVFKKLPDQHDTYEEKYSYYLKRLEQDLGLKADGFITEAEKEIINSQKITSPEQVQNLRASVNNGTVSLSWNPSKGAAWYRIIRNDKTIATITNTYYVDKEAKKGINYTYHVIACKYELVSMASTLENVYIKTMYK